MEVKAPVEVKTQVGETAGKIWHLLNDEGPQTIAQIKKQLRGSGDMALFAIGWLAREGKIDITPDKKNLRVALS
jgi:hypothetical protein